MISPLIRARRVCLVVLPAPVSDPSCVLFVATGYGWESTPAGAIHAKDVAECQDVNMHAESPMKIDPASTNPTPLSVITAPPLAGELPGDMPFTAPSFCVLSLTTSEPCVMLLTTSEPRVMLLTASEPRVMLLTASEPCVMLLTASEPCVMLLSPTTDPTNRAHPRHAMQMRSRDVIPVDLPRPPHLHSTIPWYSLPPPRAAGRSTRHAGAPGSGSAFFGR
jgi:hypothetical protein